MTNVEFGSSLFDFPNHNTNEICEEIDFEEDESKTPNQEESTLYGHQQSINYGPFKLNDSVSRSSPTNEKVCDGVFNSFDFVSIGVHVDYTKPPIYHESNDEQLIPYHNIEIDNDSYTSSTLQSLCNYDRFNINKHNKHEDIIDTTLFHFPNNELVYDSYTKDDEF